jgi:polysaccharide biosynthesis protein PslJ
VPIALYLARTARTRKLLWWGACAVLALGALATLSRTGVLMLTVVGLVFLWLRTSETMRLWPLLVPFLAVIHFALPGTLGSIKASFLPEGGLIASQSAPADEYDCSSSGRIADTGPALDQLSGSPLLGIGYGTRIVAGDEHSDPPRNACILDDQWLGTLLETGIVGVLAWVWLFTRLIRRLGRGAAAAGRSGELCVALAACIGAYAVSMFTFDAFGFVQVTFLLFLLMGVAAATLVRTGDGEHAVRPAG